MAAFEGSQKNMLQGVSQQLQRERLEGQVTAQVNMMSDVVTGLRRRPGAEVKTAWLINNATVDRTIAFDADIAGQRINCVLNGVGGVLRVADANWGIFATVSSPYLIFADRTNIQTAVINDRLYILNKDMVPYVASRYNGVNSQSAGFFYIKAGAFQTTYAVTVSDATGFTVTGSYTTPPATDAGAAAASTPEYIAARVADHLAAQGVTSQARLGPYIFLRAGNSTSVTTAASSNYIGVSNTGRVQTVGDLPAKLHVAADAYSVAVGSSKSPTYYRWEYATSTWQESQKEGSALTLGNMPVYLHVNNVGVWSLGSDYEGRFAGDDNTNPDPGFVGFGIDGMGSFQGRLVLLHGSKVSMSASNRPSRFYRSTIESILSSDPIEVGASANSSAAYEYCLQFNKDLLLFSEKYQALIPGGGSVVTPQNATVVVTSTYESDMTSGPLPLGRTVMYPAPRSKDFFGMLEMLPSPYTDSQYVSSDVTAHLPKYLNGRCRFSVSSSVAGIAVFGSTTDTHTLVVHEYTWDGDEKAQQAWHKWVFPYPIADAFFAGSEINLLFVNNGQLVIATIDPRIGTLTAGGERRPFLDLYFAATVTKTDADATVGGVCPIPAFYQAFDTNWHTKVRLSDRSADLLGEEVGIDVRNPTNVVTVPSFGMGSVTMGIPYRSTVGPSMPSVKDRNGVVISSNKLTILRFMVGTANSYEFEAIVHDAGDDGADSAESLATLYWGSTDLDLGDPRIALESTTTLPCRTNAASTTVLLYTDSLSELNIVSLEYVCRYNQKLTRR